MKASHFLVRQESGKEAPGPSVPLKNTNSNANNWRICVFFNASLRWPRNPACGPRAGLAPGWPRHAPAGAERQMRWRFPSRAKQQERHSRAHTLRVCRKTGFGIGRPTARLPLPGKLFLRSAFPHARGAKCWPVCGPETPSRPARFPISFFDVSEGCEHTNVILIVSCAFEKCHSFCRSEVRNHRSEAYGKMQICHSLAKKSAFFSRAEGSETSLLLS